MEENQMPKKRNYERYLEAQEAASQGGGYSAPKETWAQDPFSAQPAYQEPVYQEPAYQEPVYQQPETPSSYTDAYSQPVTPQSYEGLEEPVTKGEWALCFFLMMIPCVGIIMMFVWAFSKTEKKSKSNFFKVQLIFVGVIFVLYFLLFLFAMSMGVLMA